MHIEKLPVDFKDDIINEDTNGLRKYQMIQNIDGTVSFKDVTDYLVIGSTFGAKEIVETNSKVNEIIKESKFYGIVSLGMYGMKLESYQISEGNTQATGYGYAWGAEIEVGEIMRDNSFRINLQPNTAYRFKINPITASSWGKEADYRIIDSYLSSDNHGANIKELYTNTEDVYKNGPIFVVVYNHCEHEVRLFELRKRIMLKALSVSDYSVIG